MTGEERQRWGRIGGLTAHSRHSTAEMTAGARRGFRERFRRLVDPDGLLSPPERELRAERAMRAHMLTLSDKSARARRRRLVPSGAGPAYVSPPADSHEEAAPPIVTRGAAMPAAIDADRPHPTRKPSRADASG